MIVNKRILKPIGWKRKNKSYRLIPIFEKDISFINQGYSMKPQLKRKVTQQWSGKNFKKV